MSDFWVGTEDSPETYRLVSLLGGGGEGEVWRAVLPLSESGRREVAVKLAVATGATGEAESWQKAGHLLSALSHPGLVRVTDTYIGVGPHRADEDPGPERYRTVVMDYIEGPTVREWCAENPDATASARLALLRDTAAALDEMHSGRRTKVPVAHGDVKAANIVVSPAGSGVLVDLGLARLTDAPGTSGRSNPYAAPELRGWHMQATPAADVYAFVVTLAQVLVGAPPPTDADGFLDLEALGAQLAQAPATRGRPQLREKILGALVVEPGERPAVLRSWLDGAVDTLSQISVTAPLDDDRTRLAQDKLAQDKTEIKTTPTVRYPVAAGAAGAAGATGATGATAASPAASRPGRRRLLTIGGAAAVVVVLAVAGVLALRGHGSPGDRLDAAGDPSGTPPVVAAPAATTPAETPDETPDETPTDQTSSPAATPSTSPESTPLPPDTQLVTTQWVNEMDTVDDGGDGDIDAAAYATNGTLYPHSLDAAVTCDEDEGGDFWFEYDLARSWTSLTATVGVADDSAHTARISWKVIGDGKVLKSGTSTLGTSTKLDLDVTNVLRLRVLVHDDTKAVNCYQNDDVRESLVLGDLELGA